MKKFERFVTGYCAGISVMVLFKITDYLFEIFVKTPSIGTEILKFISYVFFGSILYFIFLCFAKEQNSYYLWRDSDDNLKGFKSSKTIDELIELAESEDEKQSLSKLKSAKLVSHNQTILNLKCILGDHVIDTEDINNSFYYDKDGKVYRHITRCKNCGKIFVEDIPEDRIPGNGNY